MRLSTVILSCDIITTVTIDCKSRSFCEKRVTNSRLFESLFLIYLLILFVDDVDLKCSDMLHCFFLLNHLDFLVR